MNVTRIELYEMIWTIGSTKTAKDLQIPYDNLKKICTHYQIPIPTSIYWTNLRLGKTVIKSPLPNIEENPTIELNRKDLAPQQVISSLLSPVATPPTESYLSANNISYWNDNLTEFYNNKNQKLFKDIYNTLKINKTLSTHHKSIVEHKKEIQRRKKENTSWYPFTINRQGRDFKFNDFLDTNSTSLGTLPKGYLFLDSLIKSIEKIGGKLVLEKKHSYFILSNYKIFFYIRESYKKNPNISKDDTSYDVDEYLPSGYVHIVIGYETPSGHSETKKEFKESTHTPLLSLLKIAFSHILELPLVIEKENIKWQKILDERKIEREQKQLQHDLHQNELKKVENLIREAKAYAFSNMLKKYITSNIADSNEAEWAYRKAEWFNPTSQINDTILSESDKQKLINSKESNDNYWEYL